MSSSDNKLTILFVISLIVGVGFAVILGVLYSINVNANTTKDTKNIISFWWWIVVYVMGGGFGISAVAFLAKHFS